MKRAFTTAVACLLLAGCYHQVVQTGRAPGSTVIEKPWTSTFIFGLVAAQPIDVTQQCPSGVATVETQMSVVNALATFVTLGLWDPRTVTITCASGSAMLPGSHEFKIAQSATASERQAVLVAAMEESSRVGHTVVIRF